MSFPDSPLKLMPKTGAHPAHDLGIANAKDLEELNEALKTVEKAKLTKEVIPQFFEGLRHMIASFDQVSKDGLSLTKKRVFSLVPVKDAPEQFKQFLGFIKDQVKDLETPPSAAILPSPKETELKVKEYAPGDKANEIQALGVVERLLQDTDPVERLEMAISHAGPYKKGSTQEARRLQILLTMLQFEEELLSIGNTLAHIGFLSMRAQERYYEAAEKVVLLGAHRHVAHFELPKTATSTEDFALSIYYHQIQEVSDRLLKRVSQCKKPSFRDVEKLREIRQCLEGASKRGSEFAQKLVLYFDNELLPHVYAVASEKLMIKFILELSGSPLLKQTEYSERSLENIAAPCFSFAIGAIQKHIKTLKVLGAQMQKGEVIENKHDMVFLHSLQRGCGVWSRAQAQQQQLYALALERLNTIVFSKGKKRMRWMLYVKSLVSGKAFACELMGLPRLSYEETEELYLALPNLSLVPATPSPDDDSPQMYEPKKVQLIGRKGKRNKHRTKSSSSSSDSSPSGKVESAASGTELKVKEPEKDVGPSPLPMMRALPFSMAPRVQRWWQHLEFDPEIFPGYEKFDFARKQRYHGFSQAVDQFYDIGFQAQWQNTKTGIPNQRHIIPAEFEFGGVVERGAIIYCINESGVCYHRYFHRDLTEEVLVQKCVQDSFREHDFPGLDATVQEMAQDYKLKKVPVKEPARVERDPILGTIQISQKNGLRIRLIPIKPNFLEDTE